MASTNPARGMRDFLPADVRKRNYVIDIIKRVYESYGFEPLETPAVENLETLMGKYGEEGNQLIFKVLKRGEKLGGGFEMIRELTAQTILKETKLESRLSGEPFESGLQRAIADLADLALRYDLTVPLARVVANNKNELPKFFKRYQIQPVWRADRPARGRFREFYQCDVDAIGSSSMLVEGELINAVSQILRTLGFEDFTIRINHREILRDLLDTTGVPAEKHADVLVAIDKLDKIGREGVAEELSARGVPDESAAAILDIFEQTNNLDGPPDKVNREIVGNLLNIVGHDVLADVGKILQYTPDAPVLIDPSLARGLSYYTGTIMEINVPDLAGSLGGGGRYDGLIGMFGKEQIPACGFSLGLERILVVMDERGMFPREIAESAPADVMVATASEETGGESLKLAAELRSTGLRVTVYPQADKSDKQFKYAKQIGVAFFCELADSATFTLKDMKSGERSVGTAGEIAETILRGVRGSD